MVSVDDLYEVLCGLFKEPIIGHLKFKVADIRHLKNREIAIFQQNMVDGRYIDNCFCP